MGSKNSKDVFNQLMDTIEELDAIKEKNKKQGQVIRLLLKLIANLLGVIANLSWYKEQVSILNEQVEALTEKVTEYEQQIALLREDNERMKRILNNDCSNSSIPPSQSPTRKPANLYNGRKKRGLCHGRE